MENVRYSSRDGRLRPCSSYQVVLIMSGALDHSMTHSCASFARRAHGSKLIQPQDAAPLHSSTAEVLYDPPKLGELVRG